mgnify:CR=1 FL=1
MNSHNSIMPNITLSIPEDLHKKMKKRNEIRWSSIIRNILRERVEDLEKADKLASKSKLTEKDVFEISEKIKESAWKTLKKVKMKNEISY